MRVFNSTLILCDFGVYAYFYFNQILICGIWQNKNPNKCITFLSHLSSKELRVEHADLPPLFYANSLVRWVRLTGLPANFVNLIVDLNLDLPS